MCAALRQLEAVLGATAGATTTALTNLVTVTNKAPNEISGSTVTVDPR